VFNISLISCRCGPCKHIAPIFEELSEKYKNVSFVKVDVDECPDIAQEHDVKAMVNT